MLKLLVFLPCETIIVSEQGNTSVVSVLEQVITNLAPDAPPNAAVPMKWSVLALWHREESVEGVKVYDQRLSLYWPNGEPVFSIEQSFNVSNEHINYRNVGQVLAFPVGQEGTLFLKLGLRESGEGNEYIEVAEFPINVAHVRNEAASGATRTENAETG